MKTLSKEQFIKAIEFINAQNEKQESFIAALEALSPGTYCDCLLYSSYESFVVKLLLMELLEDEKEDINYYLYENKECVVLVDGEKKVSQVLVEKGNKVISFVRFAVGEGIEKRHDNFAEEVAKQAA